MGIGVSLTEWVNKTPQKPISFRTKMIATAIVYFLLIKGGFFG